MNIYVYSDESGVFDKIHNDIFVFGGLIVLGNQEKEKLSRKYSSVEKILKKKKKIHKNTECKATNISNGDKSKLFRSLNNVYKFSAVIKQEKVLDNIFLSKKDKQRYLDYVYKIAVKRAFEKLLSQGVISANEVERLYFYVDEHTTATNGRYELQQSLEQEFKWGTYNGNYNIFYPPIFTNLKSVQVNYCNSESTLLVRASDIIANKIFFLSRNKKKDKLNGIKNLYITFFP